MLVADGVAVSYGKIRAVSQFSLQVGKGQIVAILGRNGAGKTTAVKAICGLLPVAGGHFEFDGKRLDGLAPHKIVRRGISLVPQGRELFPGLSVLDNLKLGAYTVRNKQKIDEALDRVFHYFPVIGDRQRQSAGSLSGGEQQMVAIGRALMTEPKLLILDEPSAGLAPKVLREVFDIVVRFSTEQGTSVLVAEQNAREALRACGHVYILEAGEILWDGPPAELEGEQLASSYLGGGVAADSVSGSGSTGG
jgi:branched-chain amino acid transport system ATP-binding protein